MSNLKETKAAIEVRFSPVIAAQRRDLPGFVSLLYLDLDRAGGLASPVVVLDDFRVRDLPFSPHPHAGFSAVTYVLEDSEGGVRSRTSLGTDIVVAPGGIVWTHAASGLVHEEIPADRNRELHGLQIFVNLSSRNKLSEPQVLQLQPSEVPEWHSDAGDRVRVVVGSFEGVSSPLVPVEPFSLLDVELRNEISLSLPPAHNALVYVLNGSVVVRAGDLKQIVATGHAMAVGGVGQRVHFAASEPSHLMVLSGAEIREPAIFEGPFLMNDRSEVGRAVARFRGGEMGDLQAL
jgi:hypothetical protein